MLLCIILGKYFSLFVHMSCATFTSLANPMLHGFIHKLCCTDNTTHMHHICNNRREYVDKQCQHLIAPCQGLLPDHASLSCDPLHGCHPYGGYMDMFAKQQWLCPPGSSRVNLISCDPPRWFAPPTPG
jgi:hypothetical protein